MERRGVVGGVAASEEIFPGCRVNVAAQDAGLFRREIVAELGLEAHGLEWVHPPAVATSLIGGGETLTLWRDPARTRDEIARHSRTDAARFPEWVDYIQSMARVLRVALDHPAPPLHDLTTRERIRLLRPLIRAARLGKRNVVELLRVLPLPARTCSTTGSPATRSRECSPRPPCTAPVTARAPWEAPSACSTTPRAAQPTASAPRPS